MVKMVLAAQELMSACEVAFLLNAGCVQPTNARMGLRTVLNLIATTYILSIFKYVQSYWQLSDFSPNDIQQCSMVS